MEVNCEGCAGCCVDWRRLTDQRGDHERRGPYRPLDDTYNLTPLTRTEIRRFVDDGMAAALAPRVWQTEDGVTLDDHQLAGLNGKPVFFIGLRKVPKPVGPFDHPPRWLDSCVFLDPTTLQCRLHDDDRYPSQCASYPGHNLELDQETECERVEAVFGGDRLLDDAPPDAVDSLLLGPQALGEKLFVHPEPERLDGVVNRLAAGELRPDERADWLAVAAASSPGTASINEDRYETYRRRALVGDSWVDDVIDDWTERADLSTVPDIEQIRTIEERHGAPSTQGWE